VIDVTRHDQYTIFALENDNLEQSRVISGEIINDREELFAVVYEAAIYGPQKWK